MTRNYRPLNRREALLGLRAADGLAGSAWAQAPSPSRPSRFIVPFAAATGADIACRALTQDLVGVLGQPVVVDNRGGGAGSTGSVEIAKAAPDGHAIG